ncbi:hypothetical protein SDC9_204223 [bioreactor metagenome]|uniref:Uncharacterized protein n=1 Tax=bioreactor metagenome TaxID=1076179 RepID=A0A645JAJ5_9ZZZZ
MKLTEMQLVFEIKRLKEKLNFGSELISKLDKTIRDSDLTNENNKDKVRDMCSDIEMFLKEK